MNEHNYNKYLQYSWYDSKISLELENTILIKFINITVLREL